MKDMLDQAKRFIILRWPIIIAFLIGIISVIGGMSASYWFDELYTVEYSAKLQDVLNDIHPPLYAILIAGWSSIWGTSEIATRSLSVLFWLASAYVVGRKSVVGAAFILVSPIAIENATNARMYALLGFGVSLIAVGLINRVERGRPTALLLIGTIIASFTHSYGALVSAVTYGTLAIHERKIDAHTLIWGAITGAWYLFHFTQADLSRATWITLSVETIRGIGAPFGASITWLWVLWIPLLVLMWRQHRSTQAVIIVASVSITIAAIISIAIQPILGPRYASGLIPLIALSIGRIAQDTRSSMIVVIIVLSLLAPLHNTILWDQDYRSIETLIEPNDDTVIISYAIQQGHYTNGSIVCYHERCIEENAKSKRIVWIIDGTLDMPEELRAPLDEWIETRYDVLNVDVRSYTRP